MWPSTASGLEVSPVRLGIMGLEKRGTSGVFKLCAGVGLV